MNYRKCKIREKKDGQVTVKNGIFHKWAVELHTEYDYERQFQWHEIYAIVEIKDGWVKEIPVKDIKFTDVLLDFADWLEE